MSDSSSHITAVLGASPNPNRYSHLAIIMLKEHGFDVLALGARKGTVAGVEILTKWPQSAKVHTVTLYMNPKRQVPFYEYLLGLEPSRIIFNPGTENVQLIKKAKERGINTIIGCTLVMLSTSQF